MQILLLTLGSAGDVHPFVGIGLALRARGHEVTIATNDHFEPLIRSAGLEFAELGKEELFIRVLDDPDLWHPTRGFKVVFKEALLPMVRPAYELIARSYQPGKTIVVAHAIVFGARIAQEKFSLPMATIHLAPAVLRSVHETPKLPGLFMPAWMPGWMKSGLYSAVERLAIDPLLRPPINSLQKELGIAPARSILGTWWHSPARTICLFPDWFSPPQPDWPASVRLSGFPLYDGRGVETLPPGLEEFLDAGSPPIIFTPGSAMRHGGAFFRAAVQACQILHRRGILLTRHRDQLPTNLPADAAHFEYAPFSQVLPRASAFVHHGGIGTTAQGLAAAIPQVITPFSHDQFDNALRVQKLGCGLKLDAEKINDERLSAALAHVLDGATRERCKDIANRFQPKQWMEKTCELIESTPALHV